MIATKEETEVLVVVGYSLGRLPDGREVVEGFAAIFKSHVQRFESVGEIAAAFAPLPLRPVPLPEEEGWQSMIDMPPMAWAKLHKLIGEARAAEEAGAPWPTAPITDADDA